MNDAELIEGCKAGKREALETIYRLFSRQMYGVCCRYVGEESALDVMHDGFIKVFSAIDQLHATDLHGFKSWVTRIMVTTSLHHLRKQKTCFFLSVDDLEEDMQPVDEEDMISIPIETLMKFITELPAGYRTILNLVRTVDGSLPGKLHFPSYREQNEAASRSGTVSFFFSSPDTSMTIRPSYIMMSRLPWTMASFMLCLMSVTGKQIQDALEFGARFVGPEGKENGGFLHVAGATYEIHTDIPNTVLTDDKNVWMGSATGTPRVQNVRIYNKKTGAYEPLDLNRTYALAGMNYTLRNLGDGFAMFDGAELIKDYVSEDYLVMSTYAMIFDAVNDVPVLSSANSPLASYPGYLLNYENPYGAGRIQVV